jgi:hypothetical protein
VHVVNTSVLVIEQTNVNEIHFLGANIYKDGHQTNEIKRRIRLGKVAMTKLTKIMKDPNLSRDTKIKIVRTMVFPIVLYGSESWTLRKADMNKLHAFELWVWRRLLGIPWTEKRTNASVLDVIKPKISLEALATGQKLRYFGHLIRRSESLEKDLMLGKTSGSRRRGRTRTRWLEKIKTATQLNWTELLATAQVKKWQHIVAGVMVNRVRTNL